MAQSPWITNKISAPSWRAPIIGICGALICIGGTLPFRILPNAVVSPPIGCQPVFLKVGKLSPENSFRHLYFKDMEQAPFQITPRLVKQRTSPGVRPGCATGPRGHRVRIGRLRRLVISDLRDQAFGPIWSLGGFGTVRTPGHPSPCYLPPRMATQWENAGNAPTTRERVNRRHRNICAVSVERPPPPSRRCALPGC